MGTVIVKQAATPAYYTILLAVLSIVGALFGAALGRWADARNRRREQYADAVRVLVRWFEYPFRIRRRTSDDASELRRLAEMGHDLQEQLQCHRTWVESESSWVGVIYTEAVAEIRRRTGPSIQAAWAEPRVLKPEEMVLEGWGPDGIEDLLTSLNAAIACRFGWGRALNRRPSPDLAPREAPYAA